MCCCYSGKSIALWRHNLLNSASCSCLSSWKTFQVQNIITRRSLVTKITVQKITAFLVPLPLPSPTPAQGWEFAHSLICSFAHLLILLKSNERLWAICSDRSRQMSDRERIAQVDQRKWATVRVSLRSLKTNERFAQVDQKKWATLSVSPRSLKTNEWFAQVAQRKWANEQFTQKNLAKQI